MKKLSTKSNEKKQVKHTRKTIEELTLSDSFMFYAVMQDYDLCKETIETLLDITIYKIEYLEAEKVIQPGYDSKSVRLDVYVKDDKQTVYNLEMQVDCKKNIPKRTRYYQAAIDREQLLRGADFDELDECLVIFICKFDLYNRNRAKYEFKYRCQIEPDLDFGDETRRVVYNTTAVKDDNITYKELDITSKLYNLLCYIEKQEIKDEFTKKLDDKVKSVKRDNEWREKHMQYEMNIQDALREGDNRTAQLYVKLIDDERFEEARRAKDDASYRKQLMKEYGIE